MGTNLVAACSDSQIRVYSVEDDQVNVVQTIESDRVTSLALFQNGNIGELLSIMFYLLSVTCTNCLLKESIEIEI